MTIREIAQRCGVSRGTVDRVINGRGKVSPETEALILQTLSQVGYTKNTVAKALNVRKKNPYIGVILSSEGNPFFDEVIKGIRHAEGELEDYGVGVELCTMEGYSVERQLALMEAMADRISVLVFQAINHPRIIRKVAKLAQAGIPAVTVNSDLNNSQRLCYVGSDYHRGGQTAAGILRLATGGLGCLGIITGVPTILGHVQRLEGFEKHLGATCPGIRIVARESAMDSISHAYHATKRMLKSHPDISLLMVITAGLEGVCRAVTEIGREQTIQVFAFDNIPKTEAMMRRGLLSAVVCQQPFQQGYQAVRAAFDIILHGKPQSDKCIMENQVKILENLLD